MHIFIDDSETFGKNGFLCLAGFMASDQAWEKFCIRWESLLKKYSLKVIHTSDFLSGQGEYRNLNIDFNRRLLILNEFMDVIRDEVECGFSCSIDAGEYKSVLINEKKKLKPEEFLFRRIIKLSIDFMSESRLVEPLGIWLDDSDKSSSRFLSIWSRTKKYWKHDKSLLGSISFGDDYALPPLQAADVFANVLSRSHASGVEPWHGQSSYNRLFIHPDTKAITNKIKSEIWEPRDLERLKDGIINLAKPS